MSRRLARRLNKVTARLDIDPRLGTWDDACWIGRTFGLDPMAVLREGQRLLAHCDAAGATTREEQVAEVIREGRLRPSRTMDEVAQAVHADPHRLGEVVYHYQDYLRVDNGPKVGRDAN